MPMKKCGRIRKTYSKTSKIKKTEVLRILRAIMENKSNPPNENSAASMQGMDAAGGIQSTSASNINADNFNDFFNTGRIGRRNALPDILSVSCATTSTADLPEKFNALTTTDVVMTSSNQASVSGAIVASSSSSSSLPTTGTCSSSSSNYNDSNVNPT